MLKTAIAIPDNVDIIELALCFMTSTSELYSNFGYNKLIKSPREEIRIGNRMLKAIIKSA